MASLLARAQSNVGPMGPAWASSLRKGKPSPHEAGTDKRTQERVGFDTTKEHKNVDHEYAPTMLRNDHSNMWSHTVLKTVHFDFRWCFHYARRLGYRLG